MEIETRQASLSTLAVTIQALHVNEKQMTLAVFRQLPRCFAAREPQDAQHWGIVRYDIKEQGDLWLVYSHEGHLYRRVLDLTAPQLQKRKLLVLRDKLELKRREKERWKVLGKPSELVTTLTQECDALLAEIEAEEGWSQAIFENDLDRQKRELVLAKLPQLFIAV